VASPDLIQSIPKIRVESWQGFPKKSAAVLMCFYQVGGCCYLLLIRRSKWVGTHKHQIGLPGGYRETQDGSPSETAMREYEEELGVPRDGLEILGTLQPVGNIDGVEVVPVLAICEHLPQFHPADEEIEMVYLIDINELKNYSVFKFNLFGFWRESDYFKTENVNIWGLTAKILHKAGFPKILEN